MKPRFTIPDASNATIPSSDSLVYDAPMVSGEVARERIAESAARFPAACEEARDHKLELHAHGVRHFEIRDGAKSVHVFVVEQRIEGKFRTLMTFGKDWDIYDVVVAYIASKVKR